MLDRCVECGTRSGLDLGLTAARRLALCNACGRRLLRGEIADPRSRIDADIPPPGAWFRDDGVTVEVGVKDRSLLLAVTALSGGSLPTMFAALGVFVAIDHLWGTGGGPPRGWTLGWAASIGACVAWLAVALIACMAGWCVVLGLAGRSVVRVGQGEISLFRGVGRLGRTRRFQIEPSAEIRETAWIRLKSSIVERCIELSLPDGRTEHLGAHLTRERLWFILASIAPRFVAAGGDAGWFAGRGKHATPTPRVGRPSPGSTPRKSPGPTSKAQASANEGLACPKCGQRLEERTSTADDDGADMLVCRPCGLSMEADEYFRQQDLRREQEDAKEDREAAARREAEKAALEELVEPADAGRGVHGTWCRDAGGVLTVGASARQATAGIGESIFGVILFGVWCLLSVLAAWELLAHLGLFGVRPLRIFTYGGRGGFGPFWGPLVILVWLPLMPVMLGQWVMARAGRVEVVVDNGQGRVFEGVGKVGRTRRFEVAAISTVGPKIVRGQSGPALTRIVLTCEGGRRITFARSLPEDRLMFLLRVLHNRLGGRQ